MSQLSDYMENIVINHIFRNQAYTPPTIVYVALFTSVTGLEANTPSAEVIGNAYARQAITFSAASGGATSNSSNITFPTATPSGWGLITHVAIVDHVSNTSWGSNVNVLAWGALSASKQIDANDTFQISASNLTLTVA
jgi:hypothetical protein